VVICLKRGADLHMTQLMPLPLLVLGWVTVFRRVYHLSM